MPIFQILSELGKVIVAACSNKEVLNFLTLCYKYLFF